MRIDVKSQKQLVITILLALFFAAAMPRIFLAITELGHNIPNFNFTDKVSDYLKGWATALFFMAVVIVVPVNRDDKRNLKLLWLAKILVTLVFMLFYEANYGLDAYWYFDRSQDRVPDLTGVGFGNGTANMAAWTWVFEHYIIPSASFHTQKVICAFIGTMGIFALYRALKRYRPEVPKEMLLAIGLFPTVLFWSSTLGKDALIVFGISLTFFGMLRMLDSRSLVYLIPAVIGLVITAAIRLWLAPILVISFAIVSLYYYKNILFRMALIGSVLAGGVYIIPKVAKQLSVADMDQLASRAGAVSRSWQRGGSAGDVPIIKTPSDAMKFLPIGMFTALFRPLPGEIMNPFGLLAGIENLLLLILLWKAIRAWTWETWKDELVVWFLTYVILWGILYAFISPQNLGAAVRFKVQSLPELLFLLAYVAYIKPRSLKGAVAR